MDGAKQDSPSEDHFTPMSPIVRLSTLPNPSLPNESDKSRGPKIVETIEDAEGRLTIVSIKRTDGDVLVFKHRFPDVLQHHYHAGNTNQKTPLFTGDFKLIEGESTELYTGGVWFSWTPTPRVVASGERFADDDLDDLLCEPEDEHMWTQMASIEILAPESILPQQPEELPPPWSETEGTVFVTPRLRRCEIGSPVDIDRMTFLVPNGWEGLDGLQICNPEDRSRHWRGRTIATGSGWVVTIDRLEEARDSTWDALKDTGGTRATHVGEIRKEDSSSFNASEADQVLEIIRIALSFAVGRSVNCVLPVAWKGAVATWARWASGPVDPYKTVWTWLDPTLASQQMAELLEKSIKLLSGDEDRLRVFRYAQAYYVTANYDVDAELSVAIPVSGLQLLAYSRFVEELKTWSKTKWEDQSTEEEIRTLLDDCGISTSIPNYFTHLTAVSLRLQATGNLNAPPDALSCIIKMRNSIIHPTRKQPYKWSVYEWGEAGMMSRQFLQLTILHMLGYQHKLRMLSSSDRWVGSVEDPPWVLNQSPRPQRAAEQD